MRTPRGSLPTPWAILAPLLAFALIAVAIVVGRSEIGSDPAEGRSLAAESSRTDTVVVGHPRAPAGLNRTVAADPLADRITAAVAGEHLLRRDETGAYLPQLAEELPRAEPLGEGMAVTFRIRPDARWSDGVSVSSRDVAFTWRALTDSDNRIANIGGWGEITDVATPDARTAVVVFRRPFAGWRALFASPGPGAHTLLPAHRIAGRGLLAASLDSRGIGTGPYRVAEYVAGERLVLEADDGYWNADAPRPGIARIIHVFLDEAELAARVRDGTVDLVSPVDFTAAELLTVSPGIALTAAPGPTWEHLHFNLRDPVMDDPDIRRAVARAIDVRALIRAVGAGATPIESVLVPEDGPYFVPAWETVRPDASEVQRLLGQAGYVRRGGGFSRAGRPLTLDLVATRGTPQRMRNLALLATQLEAAGFATRTRINSADVLAGRFQIALTAVSADADPSLRERYGSDRIPSAANQLAGRNIARVADADLDRRLEAADTALAEARRIRLTTDLQRRLAGLMVGRPLYRWPQVVAHRDDLLGVELSTSALGPFADVTTWRWRAGP